MRVINHIYVFIWYYLLLLVLHYFILLLVFSSYKIPIIATWHIHIISQEKLQTPQKRYLLSTQSIRNDDDDDDDNDNDNDKDDDDDKDDDKDGAK